MEYGPERRVRTVTYTGRRRGYAKRRARHRRLLAVGLTLAVVVLLCLPFLPRIQEAIQREIYPLKYAPQIRADSREFGVDPTLVAGVVYVESRFGYDSESSKGAYGLMQLMPSTAKFISERSGIRGDYRDPEVNLRMGTWYLSYLESRYPNNKRMALAAYNSGEGRVNVWALRKGFDIRRDIPYKETRDYVQNVLEAQKTYRELYGKNLNR